jgi:hypothetical protein
MPHESPERKGAEGPQPVDRFEPGLEVLFLSGCTDGLAGRVVGKPLLWKALAHKLRARLRTFRNGRRNLLAEGPWP